MRLQLILPGVDPTLFQEPSVCPYQGCGGAHFVHHQDVVKPLKDTQYKIVSARRYRCLRCRRTFRIYPQGVTHDHVSQRVKRLAVLLYLLGLSYEAVSLALDALGVYIAKSSVYEAVQAVVEEGQGMKRTKVFTGIRTPALGSYIPLVKRRREWLPLDLTMDKATNLVLTADGLSAEDAATLKERLVPIIEAIGAELLITDDADAFQTGADEPGPERR